MYIAKNTVKVSDLRRHTAEVLDEVEESNRPVMVFSRSQPKVVMISYSTFESMKNGASSVIKSDTEPSGIDFLINTPEKYLIKTKGLDAVKLIRELRD
ncbi:MAG: type II toxin-antitoxin system Phd/YefM family antitoxin [Patescibacteria group bacterium]